MNQSPSAFYVTGGTLRRDAPSYVPRQADQDLHEDLRQGKFCYVLTSRQMGKSSLMVRTAARLREEGATVAILDLTRIGQNLTPEQWYDGLLGQLGEQLNLSEELEAFWLSHDRLGPLDRWMRAVREIVLPRRTGQIVIFVDEIDAVRSLPFSTDEFFAAIRECYNRRTEAPDLARLTFCLLGVATPSDLIRDTRTTPFNIGQRIELNDFTEAEAAPLAKGLGRDQQTAQKLLRRVLYWTSGHPYLTQRLCQAVAEDAAVTAAGGVDRLCEELFFTTRARERDDNLLFVRERMLRSEGDLAGLLDLYSQVLRHRRVRDDETNSSVGILLLSGVSRVAEGLLHVRNRVYDRVFDQQWITANMPDAELQRQRAAYHRGVARTATLAALVLIVLTTSLVFALGQRNYARAQERQAKEALSKLQIALADAEEQRGTANTERQLAESARQVADVQRQEAEEQRAKAEEQEQIAQVQTQLANRQTQLARNAQETTRSYLYNANLNLAQQLWERAKIGRMLSVLNTQKPVEGEKDLRGFEWHYLWNSAHNDQATLPGYSDKLISVLYSRDGKRLVTASKDGIIKILDVRSQREVNSIPTVIEEIRAVAISPDNSLLAVATASNSLRLIDLVLGKPLLPLTGHIGEITSVAFSPNGQWLATASTDKTVKLWEVKNWRELATLIGHTAPVLAVAFSGDNRKLVTGSQDDTAKVWDLVSKNAPLVLKHTEDVYTASFSADGKILATADQDGGIKVWDAASAKLLNGISTGREQVKQIAFSHEGRLLATANADSTVALYDLSKDQQEGLTRRFWPPGYSSTALLAAILKGHTETVTCIAFSPDDNTLVTGSTDRTIKLWDVKTAEEGDFILESPGTNFLSTSLSGKKLAVSRETGIEVIELATRTKLFQLNNKSLVYAPVAFSLAEEDLLAIAGREGRIALWDTRTTRLVAAKECDGSVNSIAFSHDGKLLAASIKKTSGVSVIEIMKVGEKLAIRTTVKLEGGDGVLAFSSDNNQLVFAGGTERLKLLDLTSQSTRTLGMPESPARSIACSPDGQWVVTLSSGGIAEIWNVLTGEKRVLMEGREEQVTSIGFLHSQERNRNSSRLVTTGGEGTVRLWDTVTWQEVASVNTLPSVIQALALAPDGSAIFIAGNDDAVRMLSATKRTLSVGNPQNNSNTSAAAAMKK